MIDLSELVYDDDFAQPMVINRTTGVWGPGGWLDSAPTAIPTSMIVQPAKQKDLEMVPEGDRVSGAMGFIAPIEIYTTRTDGAADPNAGTSDRITWRGDVYRVVGAWPWGDFGFWKAIGVRIKGS